METTEYQVIIHQFEKLEKGIEHLIRSLESQEGKNLELANKMGRLEEELRKRIESEQRYSKEKTLIRSNIDNLLIKLEHILNLV